MTSKSLNQGLSAAKAAKQDEFYTNGSRPVQRLTLAAAEAWVYYPEG